MKWHAAVLTVLAAGTASPPAADPPALTGPPSAPAPAEAASLLAFDLVCRVRGRVVTDPDPQLDSAYYLTRWASNRFIQVDLRSMEYCDGSCGYRPPERIVRANMAGIVLLDETVGQRSEYEAYDPRDGTFHGRVQTRQGYLEETQGSCRVEPFSGFERYQDHRRDRPPGPRFDLACRFVHSILMDERPDPYDLEEEAGQVRRGAVRYAVDLERMQYCDTATCAALGTVAIDRFADNVVWLQRWRGQDPIVREYFRFGDHAYIQTNEYPDGLSRGRFGHCRIEPFSGIPDHQVTTG